MNNHKYEEGGSNVSATSETTQNNEAQSELEDEVENLEDVPAPDDEQDEDSSNEEEQTPEIHFDNIPGDLADLRRWALLRSQWCAERGEEVRRLCQPDDTSADIGVPQTWCTLEEARIGYESGQFDGLGLALKRVPAPKSSLVAVYLSSQRKQLADGSWAEWNGEALELVRSLSSYTEISERGDGLYVFLRATLPDGLPTFLSDPTRRLHLIHEDRFLVVTGQLLDDAPSTIEDATPQLRELYERLRTPVQAPRPRNVLPLHMQLTRERLLEKARAHPKSGKEFQALFDGGDATVFGGDSRAAMLKLLGHLAYWSGRNASLMEELFLDSRLYLDNYESLPAWDEPHFLDGRTFGAGTLDAAIQGCEKVWGGTFALEPADMPIIPGFEADEFGNGERFAAQHEGRAKYCAQKGTWTVYDIEDGRWMEGARANIEAEALAKLTSRSLKLEADRTTDPIRHMALLKHAQNSRSVARLGAMLKAARLVEGMTVDATDFDRNPLLLNVQNGTLDLESGRLRPNDPADLLSRLAPVTFDPKAKCPLFEAFVKKVFDGDEGMVECVQRALGISLTGLTTQRFFILQGLGANGKSTLLQAIVPLLGSYAHEIDPELLLVNDGDRRFETAHLVGKRLVVTSENEADARLHEGRIKRWTGGEQLTGEFKHQNSFTFSPQFKLFFNTNALPAIRGTNHGIWRRPVPIPFRREFWTEDSEVKGPPELKADEHLPAKLKGESSGILNWLLEGSLRWQRHGVYLPQEVLDARDSYRRNQDALGPFLDACCALEAGRRVLSSDLYGAYTWWCQQNNLAEKEVLTRTKFGMNLSARGFVNKRDKVDGKVQWVWKGIGLAS